LSYFVTKQGFNSNSVQAAADQNGTALKSDLPIKAFLIFADKKHIPGWRCSTAQYWPESPILSMLAGPKRIAQKR
jgi:hypothetical protein